MKFETMFWLISKFWVYRMISWYVTYPYISRVFRVFKKIIARLFSSFSANIFVKYFLKPFSYVIVRLLYILPDGEGWSEGKIVSASKNECSFFCRNFVKFSEFIENETLRVILICCKWVNNSSVNLIRCKLARIFIFVSLLWKNL